MPNYIDFSAAPPPSQLAQATLDTASVNGGSAIEIAFCLPSGTTATLQTLCTIVQTIDSIPTLFSLCLTGNAVGVRYAAAKGIIPVPEIAEANFDPSKLPEPILIGDGAWHVLSVALSNQQVTIFVDGVASMDSPAEPVTYPFAFGEAVGGPMVLGGVNLPFTFRGKTFYTYAGTFNGYITEVRVWNSPAAFAPTPFAPVGLNANSLTNYWPFWTNASGGPNGDMATATDPSNKGAKAELTNCSWSYSNTNLIYDPWNEAVLNSAPQPFPALSQNNQPACVADLMNQLVTAGVIQQADATLAKFRILYGNSVKTANGVLANAIELTQPSQTDAAYRADFATVKKQLYAEASTASQVYQYQNDVTTYLITPLQTQITAALSAVGTNLTVENPDQSTTGIVQLNPAVSSNLDDILDVVETAMEFAIALGATRAKPRKRRLGSGGGESGSAALQLAFALLRFFLDSDGGVSYAADADLNEAFNSLSASVDANYGQWIGTLNGNVIAVVGLDNPHGTSTLGDWGKLNTLFQNSDSFGFPFTFSQQSLAEIMMLHQTAFFQDVLTSIFPLNGYGESSQFVPPEVSIVNSLFYWWTAPKLPVWNTVFNIVAQIDSSGSLVLAPSDATATYLTGTLGLTQNDLIGWWPPSGT